MVLRNVFGANREDVTSCRKRLHKEGRYDPYFSANKILVNKSNWTRWAGHMAGKGEVYTGSCWENLNERDHLELLGLLVENTIKMELKT